MNHLFHCPYPNCGAMVDSPWMFCEEHNPGPHFPRTHPNSRSHYARGDNISRDSVRRLEEAFKRIEETMNGKDIDRTMAEIYHVPGIPIEQTTHEERAQLFKDFWADQNSEPEELP